MRFTRDIPPRSVTAQWAGTGVLGVLVVGALWGLHTRPRTPARVELVTVLIDASPTNATGRCDDVAGIVQTALSVDDATVGIALFATGDRSTGNEPQMLGPAIERARRGLHLETTDLGPPEADALVGEARARCQAMPSRDESPIFRGVAAAMTTLGPKCAHATTACRLVVRTDGLEEQDDRVMARLMGKDVLAPPRIDNTHVEVVFCGLTARTLSRTVRDVAAVATVAEAFGRDFTAPVRFEAACPSIGVEATP